MVPSIGEAGETKARSERFRVTGPVGVLVTLAIMIFFLVTEPDLAWFILPALLVGVAVALILRSSGYSPTNGKDLQRPEIQITKITVNGPMGLVFTLGTMAIFLLALPDSDGFCCWPCPSASW